MLHVARCKLYVACCVLHGVRERVRQPMDASDLGGREEAETKRRLHDIQCERGARDSLLQRHMASLPKERAGRIMSSRSPAGARGGQAFCRRCERHEGKPCVRSATGSPLYGARYRGPQW